MAVELHTSFLSTLSLRRATQRQHRLNRSNPFLSTLSLRRATRSYHLYSNDPRFLSTLSLRRATSGHPQHQHKQKNFYPRSPCGERPVPQQENGQAATISIHALLAESDEYWVGGYGTANNFYPRSPCGERQDPGKRSILYTPISIHALLAESDASTAQTSPVLTLFLSTLSLRRATVHNLQYARI